MLLVARSSRFALQGLGSIGLTVLPASIPTPGQAFKGFRVQGFQGSISGISIIRG